DDVITEGSEAFTLSTGTVTGQVTNTAGTSGTATITDNDTSTISVSSPTIAEGANAVFTVSLSKATSTATSFTPSLATGTATIGTDTSAASTLEVSTDGGTNWTTVSGAVGIAAGATSLLLRVATTDDVIAEGSESFSLSTGTVTG